MYTSEKSINDQRFERGVFRGHKVSANKKKKNVSPGLSGESCELTFTETCPPSYELETVFALNLLALHRVCCDI